jgi:hypothetical protein
MGALAAWSDYMIKRTTLDTAKQKMRDSHIEDGVEETAAEEDSSEAAQGVVQ